MFAFLGRIFTLIEISNLTKVFKTAGEEQTVLNNISLNIEKGDIFGIIGVSGAGKSTLLRCIGMMEKPTSGKIVIDGVDITNIKGNDIIETRKKFGVIAQGYNLLMQRNVLKNVTFPLELSHMEKSARVKIAMEMLEIVGLKGKELAFPSQLSGGQKQRVAIARALAGNPPVILCDEPTSALDSMTTKAILELIANINKTFNVTIVIITHDMGVVKSICNKVAVIDNSVIVESGKTSDIIASPKKEETKRLLLK